MIKADFHTHSHFSGDSNTSPELMIQKAQAIGLNELCFTEHMDIDYPIPENESVNCFLLNTEDYLRTINMLKDKYKDTISIQHGVELGMQPHLTDELNSYVNSYPFDFVIASEHVCQHMDPYFPVFYEERSESEAYRAYFEELLVNVRNFDNYDVVGHIDYVVRYGPTQNLNYTYAAYANIIDEILKIIISKGKGIEINTSGYRHHLNAPNPCADIVKRYHELKGEIITVGSDAHKTEFIADSFTQAEALLTSCGFRYITVFEQRKPRFIRF